MNHPEIVTALLVVAAICAFGGWIVGFAQAQNAAERRRFMDRLKGREVA